MKKLLFLVALFATLEAKSTHIIGGQITSRCLGGLTQEVTLTLYADVQGIPVPNSTYVNYSSNNFTWSNVRSVSHTSPYSINPAIMAYDFVDTVTLPYVDSYTLSYMTCCRSAAIANVNWTSNTTLYIESITSVDSICNSTPIIPVNPCPYVMVNTQTTYPLNAYDLDGDSLGYQLVTPLEDNNLQLSGYMTPPMTISPNGVLNIYSSTVGTYDICIKVTEYRNGTQIGYVIREMHITVSGINGINEIENEKSYNFNECDVLGRKVGTNYNGVKIKYKQ